MVKALDSFRAVRHVGAQRVALESGRLEVGTTTVGRFLNRTVSARLGGAIDTLASLIFSRPTAEDAPVNRQTVNRFKQALRESYGNAQAEGLILEFRLDEDHALGRELTGDRINDIINAADERHTEINDALTRLRNSEIMPRETLEKLIEQHGETAVGLIAKSPLIQERMMQNNPLSQTEVAQLSRGVRQLRELELQKNPIQVLEMEAVSMVAESVEVFNPSESARILVSLGEYLAEHQHLETNPFAPFVDLAEEGRPLSPRQSLEELSDMIDAVDKQLENKALSPFARETLTSFRAEMQRAARELLVSGKAQEIVESLPELQKPGGKKATKLEGSLGAGIGVFGLEVGSAGVKVTRTKVDERRSDHRAERSRTAHLGLYTKLGIRSLAAKLSGSVATAKGTVYPDLKSMARSLAERMYPEPKPGPLDHRGLTERLRNMGVLEPQHQIDSRGEKRPAEVKVRRRGVAGEMAADLLSAAVNFKGTAMQTRFQRRMSLLDALERFPDLKKTWEKTGFPVELNGVVLSGADGREALTAIEAQIQKLTPKPGQKMSREDADALLAIRTTLMDAVETLEKDFRQYEALVRQTPKRKNPLRKRTELQKQRKAMEQARGVKSPEQYLANTIHTFARLSDLINATEVQGASAPVPAKELAKKGPTLQVSRLSPADIAVLDGFARELAQPQMPLSSNAILAETVETSGRAATYGASISVTVPSTEGLVEIVVGVEVRRVVGDINPDNDGTYISADFEVRGGVTAAQVLAALSGHPELAEFTASLNQNPMFEGAPLDAGGIFTLTAGEPTGLGAKFSANTRFALQFKSGENGTSMEYFRVLAGASAEATTGTILVPVPGAPGVNLGAQVSGSASAERTLYEALGTDSLSYLAKRYNGARNAGENGDAFIGEMMKQHPKAMSRIMVKAGTPGNKLYKEIQGTLGRIKDSAFSREFNAAMEQLSAASKGGKKPPAEIVKKAETMFKQLMDRQHKLHQTDAAKRLKLVKKSGVPFFRRTTKFDGQRPRSLSRAGMDYTESLERPGTTEHHGLPNVTGNNCFLNAALNSIAANPGLAAMFDPAQFDAQIANRLPARALDGRHGDPVAGLRDLGQRMHEMLTAVQEGRPISADSMLELLGRLEGLGLLSHSAGSESLGDTEHASHVRMTAQHDATDLMVRLVGLFGNDNGNHLVPLAMPARGGNLGTMVNGAGVNGTPDNLTVNLNRGVYDAQTGGGVNRAGVDVPLQMTVNGANYRLRSVVVHHGENPTSGHYTAITRQGDEWALRNDRHVTPLGRNLDEAAMEAVGHGSAFVYERVD